MSPRFRRWSTMAFVVLVPVALHTLWDVLEVRATRAAIDAVAATGAPVNRHQLIPPGRPDPQNDAAPYYAAAAALARISSFGLYNDLVASLRAKSDPAPLVAKARAELTAQADALAMLDRATGLEFRSFRPGTEYGYRASQLWALGSVTRLRTVHAGVTGDTDAAGTSLVAELALFGSSRSPISPDAFHNAQAVPYRLQLALDRGAMSAGPLAAVASALARSDEDDRLQREVMAERARAIDSFVSRAQYRYVGPGLLSVFWRYGGGFQAALMQPLAARRLRRDLRVFAELLEATTQPWPQRLDAIRAVSVPASSAAANFRDTMEWPAGSIASDLAAIRAARIAVGLERYRLTHHGALPDSLDRLVPEFLDAVPIDPYSGKALVYRQIEGGYLVYSLGDNRTDDGGDIEDTRRRDPMSPGMLGAASKDIGIRVARAGR